MTRKTVKRDEKTGAQLRAVAPVKPVVARASPNRLRGSTLAPARSGSGAICQKCLSAAAAPTHSRDARPTICPVMADTNGKAASKTSSILTSAPSSYAYTSSASLLRGDGAKGRGIAVPPPTLPKYAGASSGYRLASLERLANRQRLYDHNNGTNGSAVGATVITAPVIETNGTANVSR